MGKGTLLSPNPVSNVILHLNSSESINNCFFITVLFIISFASKSVLVCSKILLEIRSSLREKKPEYFCKGLDINIKIKDN